MKKRGLKLLSIFLCAVLLILFVGVSLADDEVMDIDVTKVWQDGNNSKGTRPETVTIDLLTEDGGVVRSLEIAPDDEGAWTDVMENVPRFDADGNEIKYTLRERAVSGYTSTVEQGELVSNYEYPTNISNLDPDQEEITTSTVNVTGGTNWQIQPGLRDDYIPATQVVFNTLSVANATLTEYYADGALVPQGERVFWKNTSASRSDTNTGLRIYFYPRTSYPAGSLVSSDHYITLTFPGGVTILDGTSSGTTRDVVLTIRNVSVAKEKGGNYHTILANPLWAGGDDNGGSMGGLSMDLTFSVPGVSSGDVLISFTDIDVTSGAQVTGSNKRMESVSFVSGFYSKFYTLPLSSGSPTHVACTNFQQASDGSMRAYAKGKDSNTLQSGMVGRASLADGGFTLRWTGTSCGTQLFSQVRPFKLKVTVDNLIAGGNGGKITQQGEWRYRDYGKDEIITMTPDDGYHIGKITIDGTEIALDGFDETGVMKVTTGWTKDINKGTEEITLYQRANGVVDVYLPKQSYAVNNTAPARKDHWIDVSYESNGIASTYTVKNVLNTELTGTKTWVRGALTSPANEALVFQVKQNGEDYAIDAATQVSWNEDEYTISGLPAYDAEGNAYAYTVEEVVPAGYTVSYDADDPLNITNTLNQEEIDVVGRKNWKDGGQEHNNSDDVIITLWRASTTDGKTYGAAETISWPIAWEGNTYKFEKLPRYDDARYEYKYTVSEELSEAFLATLTDGDTYTSADDDTGRNFTNTLTGKINFSGIKTWIDDEENHDNNNSNLISLVLMRESEKVSKTNVSNKTPVWDGNTFTYSDLDKYDNEGYPYTYSVRENKLNGNLAANVTDYDIYYDGEQWIYVAGDSSVYYITAKEEITNVKHIDIPVEKKWEDANNQDGKRPDSITVKLLANSEELYSAELNDDNGWKHTFKDVHPYDKDCQPITFTITEDAVDGYTAAIGGDAKTGFTVTNTHTPETVDVEGAKTWVDNDNQDGKRPESITVNLLADGKQVKSVTVTADDDWKWSFTGLDKYKAGKEIAYTITEEAVADYTTTISGYNVTNTHEIEKVGVEGSKTWEDHDDQDGKRPENITINLLADGEKIDSKVVTAEDNWAWSFTDLDKYKAGKEIAYTVTEDAVANYTTTISGYDVTNTHEPETVDIPVEKVWEDEDDREGLRPEAITVRLLADGEEVDAMDLAEDGDWAYSFNEWPKYRDGGVEIEYTVTEDVVFGYVTEIEGDRDEGFTVTNTVIAVDGVTISGDKALLGRDLVDSDEFVIELTDAEGNTLTADVDPEDGTFIFEALTYALKDIEVDEDGELAETVFTYTLREVSGEDDRIVYDDTEYTVTVTLRYDGEGRVTAEVAYATEEGEAEGLTFTNQAVDNLTVEVQVEGGDDEGTEFPVTVTFTDPDGNAVTDSFPVIIHYEDGDVETLIRSGDTVRLRDGETFDVIGLPLGTKYEVTDNPPFGTETVRKVDVTGEIVEGGSYALLVYRFQTTSFTVTKQWSDNANLPISLTIGTVDNGAFTALESQPTVSRDGNTYTVTGLRRYHADGTAIVYAAREARVAGYDLLVYRNSDRSATSYALTGGTIYNGKTTSIRVRKVWEGVPAGAETPEITLTLYQGDAVTGRTPTVSSDGWYTFSNLPTGYTYSVIEEPVSGYTTTYENTGDRADITTRAFNGGTITNTYVAPPPAPRPDNPAPVVTPAPTPEPEPEEEPEVIPFYPDPEDPPRGRTTPGRGLLVIDDYPIPLAGMLNMNEGDCLN